MDIKKEYKRWLKNAIADADVVAELKMLNDTKIEDAFYRDLAFGTGGLRGVIGAGTNRMNIYTVAKASQGLADYLKKNFETPSVAIGYDSRIKSDVFAKVAAGVFAANGVKVNIWPVLMPVPTVSFATRYLHTSAGVMVTASHNPSKYNGYKVYGADGCQITTEAAAEILAEIEKLDIFADVKTSDFEAGVANGSIQYIPDEVYTAFVEQVKSQSVLFGEEVNKNVAIVYSPLNGTGLKPVTRTLKEMGYTNITVVKEQEQPDGNFPTCPYPNPEIKEAMALGMEYAKKCNADLLLATDPDCDRVGIAVKNKAGEYELLTGNQTGMLLLDYICSQRVKHGKMPADPVMVKTIVTMDMGEQIATHYSLRQVDLLSPSRTGVTEAEYWAQRRLDEKKQEIEKEVFTPNPTKFQTQKQLIRDAVAAAREKAISYEDFQDILQDEYDVFVKTQRGRYSYLPPERNKFISERSLGDGCKRECLEGFFVQNAEKNLRYKEEPILIFTTRTRLRLVVNLQENVKAQENLAYALKVKISNLQKMAETLVWVQENNINDLTELNDLCKTAQANAQAAYERLSQAEDELYKTNEQIHYAGQYLSTKEVQQQFTKAIFKKKFCAEHSKELDAYTESVKYFREENDGKLPSLKSLKKRKEELTKEIAERKKAYAPLREESRRLEIASDNVYSIFRKTNEMKSDLAWKHEWEAKVREKARQQQARQEQRERQPKRKKRSYDMSQ